MAENIHVDAKTGEIRGEVRELRAEISELDFKIHLLETRISDLRFYFSFMFSGLIIIISLVIIAFHGLRYKIKEQEDSDAHYEKIVRRVLKEKGGV